METQETNYKGKKTDCDCGHVAISDGFTTGYGIDKENKKICFTCCGENDKQELRDNGKFTGYISGTKENGFKFTNWPGTLNIPVRYYRFSWHNFAGRNGRMDFWLTFEGQNYHGFQIGYNSQIATIKRNK